MKFLLIVLMFQSNQSSLGCMVAGCKEQIVVRDSMLDRFDRLDECLAAGRMKKEQDKRNYFTCLELH